LICRTGSKLEGYIQDMLTITPDQKREADAEAWANGDDQQPYAGGETFDHEPF